MTNQPGAPGTAGRSYKVPVPAGRHRAPPPIPSPRAPTVIAWAAAVLTAASLVAIVASAVAPDARAAGVHGTAVSTVTRADRTAGPLVLPSIGASGAWEPPTTTTPSAPRRTTAPVSGGTRTPQTTPEARSGDLVAITTPSEPTVTPATQPVTTPQAQPTPTAPPADAAATPESSATPTTEEPVVSQTPEPTVDVDVPTEVAP